MLSDCLQFIITDNQVYEYIIYKKSIDVYPSLLYDCIIKSAQQLFPVSSKTAESLTNSSSGDPEAQDFAKQEHLIVARIKNYRKAKEIRT